MAWLRELQVESGEVWFKPGTSEGLCHVEGLLDLEEPFRVWFQDIDRSILFADPDPSRKHPVKQGRIALESRLEPDAAEPRDLLDFCQRLLCPDAEKGQEWYGYIFSAQLPLKMGKDLTVRFRDTTFWGRDGTFVEFVRCQPPYVLVAQERSTTVASKEEEFGLMLRLQCRWPV